MTTDLNIYCHKRPKEYQLYSCSRKCTEEKWAIILKVVSGILGYDLRDTRWNSEKYHYYQTKLFKLTPAQFEKMLIGLSRELITFSVS